jgi:hypothetical protein
MNSGRGLGTAAPLIFAAISLFALAFSASCTKNIVDDWRTEGLKDTVLQVVVRVPLCEKGSAGRCREDLNRKVQDAGRARAALLLRSYGDTLAENGDRAIQERLEAIIPSDGKISRILCEKIFCDALIEYSVPPLNGR